MRKPLRQEHWRSEGREAMIIEMMRRRALLIVNPRSGRGASDLSAGLDWLRSRGIALAPAETTAARTVRDIIKERAQEADCVILGGGDGTMRHAAEALMETKLPLGILPLGTANDLARTLGIPRDIQAACEVIAAGRTRQIDVAAVDAHCFFNAAHIGLGAKVARAISPQVKQRWGALSYGRTLADLVRHRHCFGTRLKFNGTEEKLRAIHIIVANGKHFGGGMTAAEEATIDDHLLTVVGIAPGSTGQLLKLALNLYRGFRNGQSGIWVRWTRQIEIETDRAMSISADGEMIASTPARFSIDPGAVSVYCPVETGGEC